MADTLTTYTGRGPDGEFTIDLPGWAREVTQVKIDKKLGDLNKKMKDLPSNLGKVFEAALSNNAKAIENLQKQQKKIDADNKKVNEGTKKHQNQTQQTQDALVENSFNNAQAIKELEQMFGKMNEGGSDGGGGMGSLFGLATKVGPFGKALQMITKIASGLFGAFQMLLGAVMTVGGYLANNLVKTFNLLNKGLTDGTGMLIGAFTDSAVNVAAEASKAGLSLSDFADALARNSEEIRVLGTEGFRELRNAVRDANGGMYDMGFANEEITQLLGREISIRQRLGMRLDIAGNTLSDDVTETARELRAVSAASGVAAETLYASAQLTDEANTLIAARGRQFGDEGISNLFRSVRQLSLRISGLAPTFGSAVTTPLVNAMTTGAIGLDSEFTDLITVFPGLVNAFEKGRADIQNSGELQADTIEDMVNSLSETSEQEFERAKMLALMTRNQTAIQAVNFASEVRARNSLIDAINDQSLADRMRDSATIATQADVFFDMMKAPFENMISNFMLSVLGVSATGSDLNLSDVISAFSNQVQRFVNNIPILGEFLDGNFFNTLNENVQAYFSDTSTAAQRNQAQANLNALVTDTISKIGDKFNEQLAEGKLGETIKNFFRNLLDNIAISIYETTGLMGASAAKAYLRQDRVMEAMDIGGIFTDNVAEDMYEQQQAERRKVASKAGVRLKDLKAYAERGKIQGTMEDLPVEVLDELANRYMEPYNEIVELAKETGYIDKDATGLGVNQLINDARNGNAAAMELIKRFYGTEFQDKITSFEGLQMDTIATGTQGGYLDYHNMAAETLVKRVMRSADYANRPLVERSMVDFFNDNEQFKSMIADGIITADELKNIVGIDSDGDGVIDTSSAMITELIEQMKLSDENKKEVEETLRLEIHRLIAKIDPDMMIVK